MASYPPPDALDVPALDPPPDQEIHAGWLVQHNRLWALVAVETLTLLALLAVIVLQLGKYRPSVQLVTLDGGFPVAWNERGAAVIDNVEYIPARLRAVVSAFIDARYSYDYQNITKLTTVRGMMDAAGWNAEAEKIRDLGLRANVVDAKLKVTLTPDFGTLHVVAQGKGAFRVSVSGKMSVTDGVRYTDPDKPLVKGFEVSLVLQSVPADVNPLGYVITSTGRDIL